MTGRRPEIAWGLLSDGFQILLGLHLFNWKHEEKGNLEAEVKSFCSPAHVLALLKEYILFAEKDEELQKFILRQHQTTTVEKVVARCLTAPPKTEARRGLVWHTHPNWRESEAALREVRKGATFALYAETDDLDEVTGIVEKLLDKLLRSTA